MRQLPRLRARIAIARAKAASGTASLRCTSRCRRVSDRVRLAKGLRAVARHAQASERGALPAQVTDGLRQSQLRLIAGARRERPPAPHAARGVRDDARVGHSRSVSPRTSRVFHSGPPRFSLRTSRACHSGLPAPVTPNLPCPSLRTSRVAIASGRPIQRQRHLRVGHEPFTAIPCRCGGSRR